jgi:hypothetical protein
MKRLLLFCLLFATCSVTHSVAIAQTLPADGLILPGESVAGVKLGSDFSSFEAVFQKHPDADEDMHDSGCAGRVYHWVDIDRGATGVYAYIRDAKIYQLSVHTPRFALSNGIKLEVPEEQVRRAYPSGQRFVLEHSASTVVGGRDLVYWVDKGIGVAIELYWDQRKKQRLVNAIDIFPKGTDYRPEGCILPPQKWTKSLSPSPKS